MKFIFKKTKTKTNNNPAFVNFHWFLFLKNLGRFRLNALNLRI